jgi:GGDEF domain-containing protein
MLVVNVGNLRKINSAHGHDKADALILSSANVLRELFPHAVLARLGADRFAALIAGESSPDGADMLNTALERAAQQLEVVVNPRQASTALSPLHRTPDEIAAQMDTLQDEVRKL